jgi:choline dehydrogenase-like flavoprotein
MPNSYIDYLQDDPFIPYRAVYLTPDTIWDWNFTTTSQTGLNGRSLPYPRGHLLGGSSGISKAFPHDFEGSHSI